MKVKVAPDDHAVVMSHRPAEGQVTPKLPNLSSRKDNDDCCARGHVCPEAYRMPLIPKPDEELKKIVA
jgi:hypothetical protein